jgi:hypothetical protein
MGLNSTHDAMKHSENYGDGYYVGTVTNNNDPLGIGRVQANVPGLYDTSKGPVPWIGPIKDSPFGFGVSSTGPFGVYGSPAVGSQIKVELQKGDENNALYTPLATKPSANPAFASPQTWGYQDPSGNQQLVNMATGSWTWTHSSGDTISYDSAGDRVVVVKGNATENVSGSLNITVQGNAALNITGNAAYTAAVHQFNGPVTMSSTLMVASDITDNTGQGNAETIKDLRVWADTHYHEVEQVQTGESTINTTVAVPQIPEG